MERAKPEAVDDMEIAPGVTVKNWKQLDLRNNPKYENDWQKAVDIVESRLMKRYFEPCQLLINEEKARAEKQRAKSKERGKGEGPYFGFTIMAINCLLVETIQSFLMGKKSTKDQSRELSVIFLTTADSFKTYFPTGDVAEQFYEDIRCGILHIGETQHLSLVRADGDVITQHEGGMVVNRNKFHLLLRKEFETYLTKLRAKETSQSRKDLRSKMKRKMDFICRIKTDEDVN